MLRIVVSMFLAPCIVELLGAPLRRGALSATPKIFWGGGPQCWRQSPPRPRRVRGVSGAPKPSIRKTTLIIIIVCTLITWHSDVARWEPYLDLKNTRNDHFTTSIILRLRLEAKRACRASGRFAKTGADLRWR